MYNDKHGADWPGAGEMSDAGEVVMALYEQLAPVATKANQPGLLDHIFGLHVKVGLITCTCQSDYLKSCFGKARLLIAVLLQNKLNLPLCLGKLMLVWPSENSSFCCIQKCMLPFHNSCHASTSAVTLIPWCKLGPMHCLGHPGFQGAVSTMML